MSGPFWHPARGFRGPSFLAKTRAVRNLDRTTGQYTCVRGLPRVVWINGDATAAAAGKPTSIFLQRFGRDASRNVIELTVGELQRYLARSPLAVARPNLTYGDCIVRYKGRVLGCGRYEDGLLVNYWPKHFTAPLPNQMPLF